MFKMGISKILMCALLNTNKKLFSQAAMTVYTDVARAWGVMLVEGHSSVKLLEWNLFLVHID